MEWQKDGNRCLPQGCISWAPDFFPVSRSDCSNVRRRIWQLAAVSEKVFPSQSTWFRCKFTFFSSVPGAAIWIFFLRTWRSHTCRNTTKCYHSGDTNRPHNLVQKGIHLQVNQTDCQRELQQEDWSSWQSRWSATGCCNLELAVITLLGSACPAKQLRVTSHQGQLARVGECWALRMLFFPPYLKKKTQSKSLRN